MPPSGLRTDRNSSQLGTSLILVVGSGGACWLVLCLDVRLSRQARWLAKPWDQPNIPHSWDFSNTGIAVSSSGVPPYPGTETAPYCRCRSLSSIITVKPSSLSKLLLFSSMTGETGCCCQESTWHRTFIKTVALRGILPHLTGKKLLWTEYLCHKLPITKTHLLKP